MVFSEDATGVDVVNVEGETKSIMKEGWSGWVANPRTATLRE